MPEGIHVNGFAAQGIGLEGDRHISDDGGQPFRHAYLFGILLDASFLDALEFASVGQQVLDGAILLDEFLGGFGTHTWAAGNVVGSIAHETQDVDELGGALDAVFAFDFLHAHDFVLAWVENLDVRRHQLAKVLVTCDHIGKETLLLGLMG